MYPIRELNHHNTGMLINDTDYKRLKTTLNSHYVII